MPSDANGVYTLPPSYLATTGQTVLASQHNAPLEDIAAGLTARMLKSGAAPMTGALQLVDGTVSAPGLTFASALGTGIFKTTNGFAVAIGGVQVFEFKAVTSAFPVGGIIDWPGVSIPSGWFVCYGQSLLRASYPDLFTAIGTTYGAADGTHFSLPDLRGVVVAGISNMGGVDRGILTGGTTYNALIGTQTVTLGQVNIPNYTLPKTLGVSRTGSVTLAGTAGTTPVVDSAGVFYGGGGRGATTSLSISDTQAWSISGDTQSGGSGTPLSIVQPTTVMNKIIFAGAV